MARFILKWRYINSSKGESGKNYVKYIATREGVEKCDESWKKEKPTQEQENFIKKLVKDFPDTLQSLEYEDYKKNPTKYTASECISRGIDDNVEQINGKEIYVQYIAKRPRVEKSGTHGLFSQSDTPIQLEKVAREVAEHNGLVWTMILSLRREGAERLGYDNAQAWKDLLRGNADTLAKKMGIPLVDLKWYAAFHNEGHHPHVHLIAYSIGQEPYITQAKLKELKSSYAGEIFKQELYQVFVEQTKYRDELRLQGREKAKELISQIQNGDYENERVELMLKALAEELKNHKGKKLYGYLPKKAKNLVDGIVDELGKDERIAKLYKLWYEQKDKIVTTYQDKGATRVPLSKNPEFKPIRNAVIKEALLLNKSVQEKRFSVGFRVIKLFHYLGGILQENIKEKTKVRTKTESKLRKAINEKKQAQGIKQE